MLQNSFGVQISYTSVDRGDGSDPRSAAVDILARLRVPAGLRDATGDWGDQEEAVLAIPVTDDGHVLTLSADDGVESTMTAAELRAVFQENGLTLWLDADGDIDLDGADADVLAHHADEASMALEDAGLEEMLQGDGAFAVPTVQVSTFSHRGPGVARILAATRGVSVDHRESGEWSLQRLETADPSGYWVGSKAELPLIELNRSDSASWFMVTAAAGVVVPFWTDAERDTRAVLDIDAITVPETAEICRRLLTEGDGSRDELLEVAALVALDVDAAHRALIPESLGGVIGAPERQRAFVAAFGVPSELIDAALASPTNSALDPASDTAAGPVGRRFLPLNWWLTARETAIAGWGELTPITRRQRPLARLADAVRRRPVWGLAIALAELGAGVGATSRWRGARRGLGVLLMIDAIIDAAIWITQIRRARR